jgi:hypothetical protein
MRQFTAAVMIAQEANRKSRQRSPLCPSRWHHFAPAISGHSLAFLLPCVGSFRRTASQKCPFDERDLANQLWFDPVTLLHFFPAVSDSPHREALFSGRFLKGPIRVRVQKRLTVVAKEPSYQGAIRKKTMVAVARQLAVDLWRLHTARCTPAILGFK